MIYHFQLFILKIFLRQFVGPGYHLKKGLDLHISETLTDWIMHTSRVREVHAGMHSEWM